jgi:hypothetical protein
MRRLDPVLAALVVCLAILAGLPGGAAARRAETRARRAGREVTAPAWSRWLELVHEHDLAPFLGARLERGDPLPADVRHELRAAHTLWAHETMFRAAELRAVLDVLAPVGGAIVLKGPAVAATSYADLGERRSSDLDLLVRDRDARRRAVALLAARGYSPKHAHDDDDTAAHDLGLVSPVADLEVDLHVDLWRAGLPAAAIEDLWATRRELPVLGGIAVLDPPWQALHAAVHALADPIGSPLLRNLLETGMLAARLGTDDRAALVDRARRFGLADRAARALGLAHQLFGSPALLPTPRPGARELWARQRLGWRYDDESVIGRTRAHVAEYHLRRLDAAGDARAGLGVGALVRTLGAVAAGHVVRRVAAGVSRGEPRLAAASATARAIGDALLVHVHATGDVHVLRDDAVAAWQLVAALDAPAAHAQLRDRLAAAAGITPHRAAAVLDALSDAGVVVESA